MYKQIPAPLAGVAQLAHGDVCEPPAPRRTVLRNGRVVDPANGVDGVLDIAVEHGRIAAAAPDIPREAGDAEIDCEGLLVLPGLIDMHLHLHDLFEVSTQPAVCAVQDGVALGLSPGAGNTFMAPALLGAEMDRGFPLNAGLYIGAAGLLACSLANDELVTLFKGELDNETAALRLTRNPIANQTAPFVVGIKEHMGHAILTDESIARLYDVSSRAQLMLMSHTQDAEHTARVAALAEGRPLHLGHTSAAGCGPNGGESLGRVLALCKQPNITGEFVTSMLRKSGGSREGLRLTDPLARRLALDALRDGTVDILVSDGQGQATMKGFGDTRDNIPAILELAEEGVLSLSGAVATMTANPARLLSARTGSSWWQRETGHLGAGALANITVVDEAAKRAALTLVNGQIASFEGRLVRGGASAGHWVWARGHLARMGVGDVPLWQVRD